jgi:hypothetical protein
MSAGPLARRSLAVDAAYCAGAGVATVAAARPLGRFLAVPSQLAAAARGATLAWAGLVTVGWRTGDWRRATTVVAATNLPATTGLLLGAALHSRPGARLLLGGVATASA